MSAGKGTAHECVLDRDCTICRGISPSEPHRLASPAQCLTANDTPRFAGRQSPQQWQHTGADASLLLCGMYTCREPMLLCKAILPWLHQTSYMSYRLCAAQACCAPSPLATMPSSSSAWQADSSLQLACTFAGSATPGPRRQRYAWTSQAALRLDQQLGTGRPKDDFTRRHTSKCAFQCSPTCCHIAWSLSSSWPPS